VDADQPQQLSPVGAPLLASYDLEALKQAWHPAALLGAPPACGATTSCCRCATPPRWSPWGKASPRCCRCRASANRSAFRISG
jgi:hypothetical protein